MRNPIHSAASTDSPRRPRALLHWGLLAACCAWSTLPAGSDVTVTASVIAGGGGTSQSSGACFAARWNHRPGRGRPGFRFEPGTSQRLLGRHRREPARLPVHQQFRGVPVMKYPPLSNLAARPGCVDSDGKLLRPDDHAAVDLRCRGTAIARFHLPGLSCARTAHRSMVTSTSPIRCYAPSSDGTPGWSDGVASVVSSGRWRVHRVAGISRRLRRHPALAGSHRQRRTDAATPGRIDHTGRAIHPVRHDQWPGRRRPQRQLSESVDRESSAITNSKIASDAVTSSKIGTSAVTTNAIARSSHAVNWH